MSASRQAGGAFQVRNGSKADIRRKLATVLSGLATLLPKPTREPEEMPMNFSNQRLDGAEFKNCSLANATFDGVNLSGAKLTNVNLAGLAVENANIKGLKIFGYDVEAWIKEQLAKDGCHLD